MYSLVVKLINRQLLYALFFAGALSAEIKEDCYYTDNRDAIKATDSILKIPVEYRSSSKCRAARQGELSKPTEIDLPGNVRSVSMASPIGRIELRWPRALEKLFGRTPERALNDAARTASKALKSGGFPTQLSTIDLNWRIVFLDQDLPEKGIPMQVVTACHPGWMYPPSDIFIVGQRVASGCSQQQALTTENADKALTRVLLHEIGHGIEFALLQGNDSRDSLRAEGFASWFESFAAGHSALITKGEVANDYQALGRAALEQGITGRSASGSPYDYGIGFLQFSLLVKKKGVYGLTRLYQTRLAKGEVLSHVLADELGISEQKLLQELMQVN